MYVFTEEDSELIDKKIKDNTLFVPKYTYNFEGQDEDFNLAINAELEEVIKLRTAFELKCISLVEQEDYEFYECYTCDGFIEFIISKGYICVDISSEYCLNW